MFAVLPCGDYYCFNEGTCEMDASGMEYCQCSQGFSGEYCDYPSDSEWFVLDLSSYIAEHRMVCHLPLLPTYAACSCLNGGECVTLAGSTTCNCPEGFTGDHCETEICESLHAWMHPYTHTTLYCHPRNTGSSLNLILIMSKLNSGQFELCIRQDTSYTFISIKTWNIPVFTQRKSKNDYLVRFVYLYCLPETWDKHKVFLFTSFLDMKQRDIDDLKCRTFWIERTKDMALKCSWLFFSISSTTYPLHSSTHHVYST